MVEKISNKNFDALIKGHSNYHSPFGIHGGLLFAVVPAAILLASMLSNKLDVFTVVIVCLYIIMLGIDGALKTHRINLEQTMVSLQHLTIKELQEMCSNQSELLKAYREQNTLKQRLRLKNDKNK